AQAALGQGEHRHALAELRGRGLLAVPLQLERAGDDLALLLRQRADLVHAAASAAAASAHRRRGLEVLVEGANAQEVDVARRTLRARHGVVVRRARVVRHGVSRLHAQLLEIERVPGRDLRLRLAALEEPDALLLAAVDRI